ncbi:methyltransferase domain-containing protein, partial [bacterium]|nr:methyltransferase domain-containing protein [bacterium]
MNASLIKEDMDPQTARVAPFDQLAADYDDQFSHTLLARWIRQQVWGRLKANFKEGDHVLELGCGTGEDAIWLARQGIRVTATDHSVEMLRIVQEKIERFGLSNLVQAKHLDMNERLLALETLFDGVFANFGVLNCVRDQRRLAEFLVSLTSIEAKALFIVMSPYCPWEMFWYLLHGKPKKAFRR